MSETDETINVSRRSFFGGALALAAVVALPASAVAISVPTIYGDGVHDDTEGFQALFDGKPFRVVGNTHVWRNEGTISLGAGSFVISPILRFPSNIAIRGSGYRQTKIRTVMPLYGRGLPQ